jgi:carboxyl-terminal processing protease
MKNKIPVLIIVGIVIACVAIVGFGYGSYYIFSNFGENLFAGLVSSNSYNDNSPISIPEFDTPQPTATPWNPELPAPDPELSGLFETVWTVRSLLQDNYLYQPVDDELLAVGAANGIELYLEPYDIFLADISLPEDAPQPEETASKANTPEDAFDAFLPFWAEWNKLGYISLPDGVDRLSLMRQAVYGMVDILDEPYTNYYDPERSKEWETDITGEYEGIGAFVDVEAEYLTIISPIKNSPAEEAGLQVGDQIIAIDGNDMTGVDPNVALTQVLGPAGSNVVLTILREGQDSPFDVEIVRANIVIPYIESEILDGDIAYLQLLRFYDEADLDVRDELENLLSQNPKGLILDLRGNPGGYLHTVVNITSEFLSDGIVLYEEFNDGAQREFPTLSSRGIATDIPLVVLIDGGSASASEIFAGAIKDYERGTLVGETTFGKGLVQIPITLPNDNGMVSITTARWLTPNQETIHDVGVEPDIVVEYTQEDFDADIDPQLDKAIEILNDIVP